jgi:RimJ/RimL family protein N-acetyltransferase
VRAYTRNMSPLHIRPLEAHEASNLRTLRLRALELAEEAFGSTLEAATLHPPTFWEHWTQASADGSVQRTFICEDENGKWLGMALVRTESASEAVLNAMWVEPEIRGRGVATALCDACSDWARAHGHERLVLVVLSDNEKARRAYEKAGFAVTDSFTAVDDNGRALNKLLCSRPLVAAENRSLAASSRQ